MAGESLFSDLETKGMRNIHCSLLLQPNDKFGPAVTKLEPSSVMVPSDCGPDRRVAFRGCTVLQLRPTGDTASAFPEILTVGGPCRYTHDDKRDFAIMMRTKEQSAAMNLPPNGDMDWPDSSAFELCPCCGSSAEARTGGRSGGGGGGGAEFEDFWLVFYPLLQASDGGTMGIRSICRLVCPECLEGLTEDMHIEATMAGTSEVVQVPLMDALEDQGPISFLQRGAGMGRRDGEVLPAYTLYQAWEGTGAWQALQNDLADNMQKAFQGGGLDVRMMSGSRDGYTRSKGGVVEKTAVWEMKRESRKGKTCEGPGCGKVHGSRMAGEGPKEKKQKKIKLKPCSGCLDALYCSVACQKGAWPTHKGPCNEKQEQQRRETEERKAKEEAELQAKMDAALASFVPESLTPQGGSGGGSRKKRGKGGGKKKKRGKK